MTNNVIFRERGMEVEKQEGKRHLLKRVTLLRLDSYHLYYKSQVKYLAWCI